MIRSTQLSLLLVLLVTPAAAFLGWSAPSDGLESIHGGHHQRPTRQSSSQQQLIDRSDVPEEGRGALDGATKDQIAEYHSIMDALRQLEDQGIITVMPNGDVLMPPPIGYKKVGRGHAPPRFCGNRMVEKLASLCMTPCSVNGNDISTRICHYGMSDEAIISACCPNSPRDPLPDRFVF